MKEERRGAVARGWQVDESARARLLEAYDLEALRDDPALKRIADFTAALCDAPVALVTLLEEHRQSFLAKTGTDVSETPREISFCRFTILGDEVMVVPDTTADERFAANPLVTGDFHVRFYAGAPLIGDDGLRIGSLCVLDTEPRPGGLTALQHQGLTTLADTVLARLRDSRDAAAWRNTESDVRRRLDESERRFHTLADTMPQMVWSTLPDGYVDYYNARWYAFTGAPEGSTDGEAWSGMLHPDDEDKAWSAWRRSLTTGEPYSIEYRLRHADGGYRWVLGRALPIRDERGAITRWFGTCTDIHAQKIAAEEREVISQELSHRIKNIFSVIAGLIGFAARGRPEMAPIADDLRQRITALGRAHDFVRPHSARSGAGVRQQTLKGLLDDLFEPYRRSGGGVTVEGDEVRIDDRSATPLALLFHELATNASKYGALSVEGGRVLVSIAIEGDQVMLTWREQGGPIVGSVPTAEGFGGRLMEMAAVRQLGGTLKRDWLPEGLAVALRAPLAMFDRG